MSVLSDVFERCRSEDRAALIGYYPAGYPTLEGSIDAVRTMVEGGCDIVEVGIPYSDPMMDGPTIQAAADTAIEAGFRVADTFEVVRTVAAAGAAGVTGTPTLFFNGEQAETVSGAALGAKIDEIASAG